MHACSFEHVMTRRAQEYGSLRHSRSFCTQPLYRLYAPPEGEESVCPLRVQMRQAAVLQQTSLPRMHSPLGVKLCPGKTVPGQKPAAAFRQAGRLHISGDMYPSSFSPGREATYLRRYVPQQLFARQVGTYSMHIRPAGYISRPYLGGHMYPPA
jgi:hypothetical protein